jgi:hypothetical protein
LGTFGSRGKAIAVDTQLRKVFIAARGVVDVFDIDTYLRTGRILIPVASDPVRIVRWGTNGLAINFLTAMIRRRCAFFGVWRCRHLNRFRSVMDC